jgi:hypothetical protein
MRTALTIASIVEGHGEVEAVPILVRRILAERHGIYDPEILKPHRVPRTKVRSEALINAVTLQARRVGCGGILVVIDADDDCAVTLAVDIKKRLPAMTEGGALVEVAIAVREYEAWFSRR